VDNYSCQTEQKGNDTTRHGGIIIRPTKSLKSSFLRLFQQKETNPKHEKRKKKQEKSDLELD